MDQGNQTIPRPKSGRTDLWVMVSAHFLDRRAQNWYMSRESVFVFMPWTEFKRELHHYFIPLNEHLRIMDECRMLRQGEGQLRGITG